MIVLRDAGSLGRTMHTPLLASASMFARHTVSAPTQRRRRASRRRGRPVDISLAIATGIVSLSTLLAACSSPGHVLSGQLRLHDSKAIVAGDTCSGAGGYSDIHAGAPVVIKDGDGKVIATSSLQSAKSDTFGICEYTYTVNVPDAPFYAVEVSHRGGLTYSREDLAGRGWTVGAELGG